MLLQAEYLKLMEQWDSTEPSIYKSNIRVICDNKGIKPRHIESGINVTKNLAKSFTSVSHKARIPFITALKLAEFLQVDIEMFLENI